MVPRRVMMATIIMLRAISSVDYTPRLVASRREEGAQSRRVVR
jgi:hypothetical protein